MILFYYYLFVISKKLSTGVVPTLSPPKFWFFRKFACHLGGDSDCFFWICCRNFFVDFPAGPKTPDKFQRFFREIFLKYQFFAKFLAKFCQKCLFYCKNKRKIHVFSARGRKLAPQAKILRYMSKNTIFFKEIGSTF